MFPEGGQQELYLFRIRLEKTERGWLVSAVDWPAAFGYSPKHPFLAYLDFNEAAETLIHLYREQKREIPIKTIPIALEEEEETGRKLKAVCEVPLLA